MCPEMDSNDIHFLIDHMPFFKILFNYKNVIGLFKTTILYYFDFFFPLLQNSKCILI